MSRIALAQTTTTGDFAANLAYAESLIPEAAAQGAALLAYPEVFLLIAGRRRKLELAEAIEGPTVARLREAAARYGIGILLGSVHERIPGDSQRVYNTAVLIGDDGELLATYRKLKLFDVDLPELRIRESDSIAPGTRLPPVIDTPIGRLGLSICFDLRFPEIYATLRRGGAQIVLVPSNFTARTGAAHWETLLRARAIENQIYVAAPAQWGRHNARYRSHGHSMLVDPWGKVLAEAPDATGLVFGEIDLAYLEKVRRELPMGV